MKRSPVGNGGGSPTPTFDLNRLSSTLANMEYSWWNRWVSFMAAGGNYLSLAALLIFGTQFTIYLATGFKNSWMWARCLDWGKALQNLRGVERATKRGETEMFLASVPLSKVHDPNEDV